MDSDGFCKSCEDLVGWGCDTCTPGTPATCTSCKYSYLMLNNDVAPNKCVHKLNNCEIPIHLQTVDTFDLDVEGNPICESCLDGYFWEESTEETQGKCEKCGLVMKECLTCSTGD